MERDFPLYIPGGLARTFSPDDAELHSARNADPAIVSLLANASEAELEEAVNELHGESPFKARMFAEAVRNAKRELDRREGVR
jgi:hypothetical protein